jgi:hypothetical protein
MQTQQAAGAGRGRRRSARQCRMASDEPESIIVGELERHWELAWREGRV